jgi:cytochrome b561
LLRSAHHWLALAFFALILLHLAAGLFHALIRRDGVFEAMSPLPSRAAPGKRESHAAPSSRA